MPARPGPATYAWLLAPRGPFAEELELSHAHIEALRDAARGWGRRGLDATPILMALFFAGFERALMLPGRDRELTALRAWDTRRQGLAKALTAYLGTIADLPRSLLVGTADNVARLRAQAETLARDLVAHDPWGPLRNTRGQFRRADPGNPYAVALRQTRAALRRAGLATRTTQDEALQLIPGLLPD